MQAMTDWNPDVIVVMGDLADFYSISSFSKDPTRGMAFSDEIADLHDALDDLDSLQPERKFYIEGNHEYRLITYLRNKAPELFETITVSKYLRLNERDWELTPYKQATKLGKLWITHDVGNVGRYSLFRAADTFQHSVVVAHTHHMGLIVEGNATGEHFVAAQFGWMGDVNRVDYIHRVKAERSWTLGFGTGLMREDGVVYLTPHPIIRLGGKFSVVLNEKEYVV